ncbi:hypothetical protein ACMAZF_11885 [Psychrobium sp. nBUS_13]|uniref:hypothetical protein n=1 Tax=Psychrobium sp. nBUS_13 TaxID=3395319 RepID=UPI003EB6E45C
MVSRLIYLDRVDTDYATLINVEGAAILAIIGLGFGEGVGLAASFGYKMLADSIRSAQHKQVNERLLKEYKDAMATCP